MKTASVISLAALVGCHSWEELSKGEENSDATSTSCVAYVVAGDTHTCARRADGTLECWGDNRYGQLGTGDTEQRDEPATVLLDEQSVSKVYLASGNGDVTSDRAAYTCALTTDSLKCWGDNRNGQLGIGTLDQALLPTAVEMLGSDVVRASAGGGHTCAQTSDGTLYCWGNNDTGQLGNDSTEDEMSPIEVSNLSEAVGTISVAGSHSCVGLTDNTLWCWGSNEYGELGVGSKVDQHIPTQVQSLGSSLDRVSTGGHHICAFITDGTLYCWGDNQYGQLGNGENTGQESEPVLVNAEAMGIVTQIYAGGTFTCALSSAGSMWCWGDNRFGQLGTSDTEVRNTPTQVAPDNFSNRVIAAHAGGAHACVVLVDGSVWCWGNNQYGQVRGDLGAMVDTPVQVIEACSGE